MRNPKLLLVFLAVFVLMGCSGLQIQLDPVTKTVLAKSSARVVGALLAKEEPKVIEPGIQLCMDIENAEGLTDLAPLIQAASRYISADPLLLATMSDLASLVKISLEDPIVTPENEALIRAAATGFKEGLQIGQGYY
jgi:hypothetical protein